MIHVQILISFYYPGITWCSCAHIFPFKPTRFYANCGLLISLDSFTHHGILSDMIAGSRQHPFHHGILPDTITGSRQHP